VSASETIARYLVDDFAASLSAARAALSML